jgi:broad specificity phosphatase PhoE
VELVSATSASWRYHHCAKSYRRHTSSEKNGRRIAFIQKQYFKRFALLKVHHRLQGLIAHSNGSAAGCGDHREVGTCEVVKPHSRRRDCTIADSLTRHGARLDAADSNWHLSTPTPYDPPLTYGGWTQCRALGVRIASLLKAREQFLVDAPNGSDSGQNGDSSKKRKRRKHKVVIHSSPFLRCIQTSVAISAGMAQYNPTITTGSSTSKSRTPSSMHSASPRLRGMDSGSPYLAPISEPKQDFAHEIARKMLAEQQQLPSPKSKLRVDAFLGEWLNPQYYEHITPPPPSALMVATAKGELMRNEHIDVYTPTISSKSSTSNLWGGGGGKTTGTQDAADDWSHVREALPAPTARRDRASSVNSGASSDTGSGRRSPYRSGHVLHPQPSTMPKFETTAYIPPTPSYAVSSSDHIPRGYVAHARNATVNADYQWDSSRGPQNWGDGGKYGEEWTSMHKRFRRGLNHLIHWYSQNDPDDRNEDALGLDQAEHKDDEEDVEEEEDLVIVMITHGAGSNALIGAITEQPVLLDVGMASLTMAVKREDAPPLESTSDYIGSPTGSPLAQSPSSEMPTNGFLQRRGSFNTGLSAMYEMKIIASTEHLRPGSDPSKASPSLFSTRSGLPSSDSRSRTSNNSSVAASWDVQDDRERNKTQSTALGSIRRPGNANSAAPHPTQSGGLHRRATQPNTGVDHESLPALSGASTPASGGLWTPPAGRTPLLDGQRVTEDKKTWFPSLGTKSNDASTTGDNMVLDHSNPPPDSRPGSAGGMHSKSKPRLSALALDAAPNIPSISVSNDTTNPLTTQSPPIEPLLSTLSPNGAAGAPLSLVPSADAAGAPLAPIPSAESERDIVPELPSKQSQSQSRFAPPPVVASIPDSLSRKLSQKGLWGTKPSGDEVRRNWPKVPLGRGRGKRRWTVSDQDGNG